MVTHAWQGVSALAGPQLGRRGRMGGMKCNSRSGDIDEDDVIRQRRYEQWRKDAGSEIEQHVIEVHDLRHDKLFAAKNNLRSQRLDRDIDHRR